MGDLYNATARDVGEPAPTLVFGKTAGNTAAWVHSRPATTIQCDPRVAAPGHKGDVNGGEPGAKRQMQDAINLTAEQACILQGFPGDLTVVGNKTQVFVQIGNAMPPQLGTAALLAVGAG